MLTEVDKKWLKEREEIELTHGCFFCAHCEYRTEKRSEWTGYCKAAICKVEDFRSRTYKDAAEFEARVAKHLMYQYEKTVHCAEITGGFCPSRDTMLMFARLAVEEEMERTE